MAWTPADTWFVPFLRGGLKKAGVAGVSDDGGWNAELVSKLKMFQKSRGLTDDGIPGSNTWRTLGPSLGPVTTLKAEAFLQAAMSARFYAYMCAMHAHGSKSAAAQEWDARHTVPLLQILEKFDHWMHESGAAALLWRHSWPDDKVPAGYPTYDGVPTVAPKKSKLKLGELGVLPLVVAGPVFLSGGSAVGAAVATAIVKTVGAAAAAASAAWLGVKLAQWAESAADSAPKVEETSDTRITIAPPPPPAEPPPSSPKQDLTQRRDLFWFVKRIGQLAAMLVGVLVAGFGVVATLTTAAAPLVTAAAGAAGGLLWLVLAAAAAFVYGATKRKGRSYG